MGECLKLRCHMQEAAAAGLAKEEFVTLQHGAMLQTEGGKDLNSPPLLPVAVDGGP